MPGKANRERKERIDEKLDQALEDTFPASDPVALSEPAPDDDDGGDGKPARPQDKPKATGG